jgi:hypothetical protein
MWLWGFQDRGNKPELSHTYALFAKINGDSIEEFYPISWVPRDGSVGLVTGDERGINLSIKQTFNLVEKDRRIDWKLIGRYEITEDLFNKAKKKVKEILEPGRIFYNATSRAMTPGRSNCIHAVSDLGGFLPTYQLRGFEASKTIATFFTNRRIITSQKLNIPRAALSELSRSIDVSLRYLE